MAEQKKTNSQKPQPRFFASCVLGGEDILEKEIETCRPFCLDVEGKPSASAFQILERHKGGIEFEAALEVGFALNYWLKTANRILLRLSAFHAQSPPRLFDRLKNVDLRPYVREGGFQFKVEARQCRVSNEKQIRRLADDLWPVNEDAETTLLLRGDNDEWVLSLDTSGEHLHKRGLRLHAGAAPLRETLAALTLRMLLEGEPWGARQQATVLDPMSGSGTFLIEAWNLDRPVASRGFAFQNFKNCPKILLSESYWKNLDPEWTRGKAFRQLVAGELDEELLPLLEKNLQQIDVETTVRDGDCFSAMSRAAWGILDDGPLWIVMNPPYGERLGGLDWVQKTYDFCVGLRAQKLAVWVPQTAYTKFTQNMRNLKPLRDVEISNGGIHCHLMIYQFDPTTQS